MTTQEPLASVAGEEPALAAHIVRRVCGRAAGSFESECTHDFPRDKYFIGCLRPTPLEVVAAAIPRPGFMDELLAKLAPMAFGAEFCVRVGSSGVEVLLRLDWSCYYRVFPGLDEQREFQRYVIATPQTVPPPEGGMVDDEEVENSEDAPAEDNEDGPPGEAVPAPPAAAPPRHTRRMSDTLFPKFRKIRCSAVGTIVIRRNEPPNSGWSSDVADLQASVNREIARALHIVAREPRLTT